MAFLHPYALAIGGVALAAPFAVHWLTKPRPRRVPLSTIRFVKQVVAQRRARHRLRDWLVLALRAAAVGLVAWAFARPLAGAAPLVKPGAAGDAVRVVLLDSSLSMGAAAAGGQTGLDRGRAAAARYVQYEPGLRADLLLAGARPNAVFGATSANFAALREALSTAAVRPERLDVQAALNRAGEILAKAPRAAGARMELVVVSDFQRTSWVRADFASVPKEAVIQFESVAPPQTPANVAIVRAGPAGRVEQGREVRLEVEVGNYGRTPRPVKVDVTAGDRAVQLSGVCPPGVRTTLAGTVVPTSSGWFGGTAKLVGNADALPADDARAFVMAVRPPPVYALLSRESSRPHASSSHYLERALVPEALTDGKAGERVLRLDPGAPDREQLAGAAVVVIDHPGRLPAETVNLLAGMVRRGKGLLYVASEPVDAGNLRALAEAAGTDLRLPVEFAPPAAGAPRDGLFLAEWKRDQSPFAPLAETMNAVVPTLRFAGGLSTRRAEGGLADDVLATYGDRSAAVVVTACGAGTVAVLNMDLSASNLPASPLFVPLVGELSGRLLATGAAADAAPCGEPLAASLPPEVTTAAGLSAVGPDGTPAPAARLTQEGSFVLWRQDAAGPPGLYTARQNGRPAFALATAAPLSESDLEPLDPATLRTRLAGGRTTYFEGAGDEPPHDNAWAWILVACATCVMAEVGVLKAFRA